MARMPYPDEESLSPQLRDRFRQLGALNVTRMMGHHEEILAAVARLGAQLLHGTLPATLRELVILRVASLCGSQYERHQHLPLARAAGVSEEKLEAMNGGGDGRLSTEEKLALLFAEQVHSCGAASDATFRQCREHFTEAQMVELCILTGFYKMIAGFLATFEVEIESEATDYRPGTLGLELDRGEGRSD